MCISLATRDGVRVLVANCLSFYSCQLRQFCCFNGLSFYIHQSLQTLFTMNYVLVKFLDVTRVDLFVIYLLVA